MSPAVAQSSGNQSVCTPLLIPPVRAMSGSAMHPVKKKKKKKFLGSSPDRRPVKALGRKG